MGEPKLRPPLVTFERLRLTGVLVAYTVLRELADPRPFSATPLARILYLFLLAEIVRQYWTWRLETSREHVLRHDVYRERWGRFWSRFTTDARFRIRRVVMLLGGLYVLGLFINASTERCTNAFQCVLLAPQMVLEQVPTILQVMFFVAMSMFQLFAMYYAIVKVGFVKFVFPGTISESFDDVWGQDEAKAKLQEQVALLESDSEAKAQGAYMPKGVLLWGPPGTGKTLLAKAVANATTKPLILVPPGAFSGMFVGSNFLKVFMLFRYVRKFSTRYNGVVVFIDEIDSLGHRGGEVEQAREAISTDRECTALAEPRQVIIGAGSGQPGTLEAFLSAMDGMAEPRGLVNKILALLGFKPLPPPEYRYMMLAATNRVSAIDPALLRAGRFGRKIRVGRPKYDGRLKTYEGYLARVDHDLTVDEVEWVARNHYKGTGAEIKDIVNEAVLYRIRSGKDGPLTLDDITYAMLSVRFGEGDGVFENPDNLWGVAVHEAGHAVAFHHLRRDRMSIWFASIEQRGRTGGMVVPSPHDDDWKQRHSEMIADIGVSQASRIAELLVLGEASNGHGGDGPHATAVAEQVVYNGHTFKVDADGSPLGQLSSFGSERDPEQLHELREQVLREAWDMTWSLLADRVDEVEVVARMLQERHTVPGRDIHDALEAMA